MSFSKYNQQAISFQTKNHFYDDYIFERQHPFYKEWINWRDIVMDYHSKNTTKLSTYINKGFKLYNGDYLNYLDQYLVDEIYCLTNDYESQLLSNIDIDEIFVYGKCFGSYMYDSSCECDKVFINLFSSTCPLKLIHLRAHLISLMWAFVHLKNPRRCLRKYYKRLERIILSLPYENLKVFNVELITSPPKYMGRGRSLLKEFYQRAIFDKPLSPQEICDQFEYLKHFIPRQQSGTSQSHSAGLITDETINYGIELINKYDFGTLLNNFLPKSQGIFDFKHKVEFDDETFSKFRACILESQTSFLEGMKDTIIESGRQLFVLFATASTVCLLSKTLINLGASIVMKLLHLIYGIISGTSNATKVIDSYKAYAQSGNDEEINIPFIPSMILNYIISPPTDILKKLWSSPKTDQVMRRIGYLGDAKIERGIERMIEWMNKIIGMVKKWYSKEILGLEWEDIDNEMHVITRWNNEVDDLMRTYYNGTFIWTDTTWSVVFNLYSRGLRFTREPAYKSYKNDVWRLVTKLGNILELFKSHGCSNQQIRNPPVVIYLYGGTGAGKSSITYPLAAEILKGIFDKEKSPIKLAECWQSLIYMRAPEQEYWDGYENQLVTVFDDFSQMKDSSANPNLELFEIIRAANCFPYPLHMASIDQKASTTFSSKVIIVSSNMKGPQCESLNFPDALRRRFDIVCEIEREFKGHTNKFDCSQYKIKQYDMQSGLLTDHINYKELVEKCVDAYFGRKNFVNSIEEYIKEQLTEPMFISEHVAPIVEESVEERASGSYIKHIGEFPEGRVSVMDFKNTHQYLGKAQSGDDEFEDAVEEIINEPSTSVDLPFQKVKKMSEEKWFNLQQMYHQQQEFHKMNHIDPTGELRRAVHNRHHNKLAYFAEYPEEMIYMPAEMAFEQVKKACDKLKNRYPEQFEAWKQFKLNHPYLIKAGMFLSMLAVGLGFLKVFSTLYGMYQNTKQINEKRFKQPARSEAIKQTVINSIRAEKESYTPTKHIGPKVESYTTVQHKGAKLESYDVVIQKAAKIEMATEQGVKDMNASEILLSVARRNLYKIYDGDSGSAIGHVLFLKGQVCIMPKHYMAAFRTSLKRNQGASIFFENVLLNRSFEISVHDLLKNKFEYESPDESKGPVATRDLMATTVGTAIYHADATQYFATKGSLSRTEVTDVMLPVLMRTNMAQADKAVLMIRNAQGRSQLSQVESLPIVDDNEVITRYVRDAWMYSLDTRDSECGAPLIVRNVNIGHGKICGVHVAGLTGTGQGWSTPVYYEDIQMIMRHFPDAKKLVQQVRLNLDEYPTEQCQIPEDAEFLRLGALKKTVSQPVKTKIEPSPLFNKIKKVGTKPCALREVKVNGESFNPRSYRLGRLGNHTQLIPEFLIENAREGLLDDISSVFSKCKESINSNYKAVYTFEEAVCGIEGEPFVNAIKRDTSAGFPFIQMQSMTKKDMFGHGMEYEMTSPQCEFMRTRVNDIIENAKKGIILDHYFVDTLKDERKPIHKAHKTRLFSAGPADYLIATKMYFNGVVGLLSKFRNWSHVSVGTNVYSNDWTEIVRELHRKSTNIIAGDFEGFDASQHQELLRAAGEVLIQLSVRFLKATEQDVLVMRVLLATLINSFHITGKEVYQWTHSLASGHYLTAIINSIFVNLAFSCVWQLAHEDISYMCARSFWQQCGIVAYGDDHLVSVPANKLEIFNQMNMPELMNLIGLSYTMENKEEQASQWSRKINEVDYLKRKFIFDENTNDFVCPLSLDTILEFPMWVKKCPDPKSQTIVELETAIKELSLHSEETWNSWFPKLNECGQSLGYYTALKEQMLVRRLTRAQIDQL